MKKIVYKIMGWIVLGITKLICWDIVFSAGREIIRIEKSDFTLRQKDFLKDVIYYQMIPILVVKSIFIRSKKNAS